MPRTHLDTSFNLVLELEHLKRYPLLKGEAHEKANLAAMDEVEALIRRHVIPHSPVNLAFRREATRDYRCGFCNAPWTEKSETYNGGCCAGDEKNNPECADPSQIVAGTWVSWQGSEAAVLSVEGQYAQFARLSDGRGAPLNELEIRPRKIRS